MVDKDLAAQDYYHGLLPREDLCMLLKRNGDFVVRSTEPKPGELRQFVVSVMTNEIKEEEGIRHIVVRRTTNSRYGAAKYLFDSVPELISQFQKTRESLSPTGNVILVTPIGRQKWELHHDDITPLKKLGEGAFGEVHMGELKIGKKFFSSNKVKVAIKLAKLESLTKDQIKEIMSEARLMRSFEHDNVVQFYGVAAGQEPLMVVMGLADCGALDSYLQKNQQTMEKKNEMILQAAWGIEYIHSKNVLHRDIASRNCLYGGGNVKIADFGLSREGTVYTMDPKKKVPIRWIPPETIKTFVYSQKTDVWAYGIMSWEIYNDGSEPYKGLTVAEVARYVVAGNKLKLNDDINPEIRKIISDKCWSDPNQRFSMPDIVKHLQRVIGIKKGKSSQRAIF